MKQLTRRVALSVRHRGRILAGKKNLIHFQISFGTLFCEKHATSPLGPTAKLEFCISTELQMNFLKHAKNFKVRFN